MSSLGVILVAAGQSQSIDHNANVNDYYNLNTNNNQQPIRGHLANVVASHPAPLYIETRQAFVPRYTIHNRLGKRRPMGDELSEKLECYRFGGANCVGNRVETDREQLVDTLLNQLERHQQVFGDYRIDGSRREVRSDFKPVAFIPRLGK